MKRTLKSICSAIMVICCGGIAMAATIAPAKLNSITLSPSNATVDAGKTQAFTMQAKDQYGKNMNVSISFSSSDTKVGTINSAGVFAAIKAGTTTIIAASGSIKGTAAVTVRLNDTIKPTVVSFSANAQTIDFGKSVTFSYSVKDSGGSGLKQIELWRSTNNKDFVELVDKRKSLSGDGPTLGSFIDTPPTAGNYYYGIHVVDNAGNWISEGGARNLKVNGWQSDGETAIQKRIVAAARAENGRSSGQSVVGSGHQTDIDGGDGAKMRNAINIYHEWKKKPGTKTLALIQKDMSNAFSGSSYGGSQINALVARIIAVYNPNAIPGSDAAVLNYLGIRKQCHEWADFMGSGEAKGVLSDIKNVRPGMGLFSNLPHAMIIIEVNWKDGVPSQYKVCEANEVYGASGGWINPKGAVPWERTVSCGRPVDASTGSVRPYE
jgi:hypothetical protein